MCASSAEDDVREKKKNIKMNPRQREETQTDGTEMSGGGEWQW